MKSLARCARGPSAARRRRPSRRSVAVVGSTTCASRGTARREETRYRRLERVVFSAVSSSTRLNARRSTDPTINVSMAHSPFHLRLLHDTPQVPCPACAAPLRKLAADAVVAGASNAHQRRVKRGRLVWEISVPKSRNRDATAKACARLFDVPRARLRLIAGGKALTTEEEVARIAEAGETVLVVGSRRGDIVATASPLDVARVFARRVAKQIQSSVFFHRLGSFLARRSFTLAPATARLWWFASAFLRSMHPGWENPYQATFDERRRRGGAGRDTGNGVAPPPRRARDDGHPHQFG